MPSRLTVAKSQLFFVESIKDTEVCPKTMFSLLAERTIGGGRIGSPVDREREKTPPTRNGNVWNGAWGPPGH